MTVRAFPAEFESPIQAARRARGFSQAALAVEVGVGRSWLALIERAPALASPELLRRLAVVLRLPPESLARTRSSHASRHSG